MRSRASVPSTVMLNGFWPTNRLRLTAVRGACALTASRITRRYGRQHYNQAALAARPLRDGTETFRNDRPVRSLAPSIRFMKDGDLVPVGPRDAKSSVRIAHRKYQLQRRLARLPKEAERIDQTVREVLRDFYATQINDSDRRSYLRQLVDVYNEANMFHDGLVQYLPSGAGSHGESSPRPSTSVYGFVKSLSKEERDIVQQIKTLLMDPRTPWRKIWHKYLELQDPRVQRISDGMLRNILRHFGAQDPNDHTIKTGELRGAYFTLLDEMARAKIKIWQKDWNTAMHLALKSRAWINNSAVDDAMQMWHTMEVRHKCAASNVTFTILYLAAAHAQQFGLADRLWREMHRRGCPVDRLTRIAEIIVGGVRRDRVFIANAYTALVDERHVVDLALLNTVITAYVRAGEVQAAEEVLRRLRHSNRRASTDEVFALFRDWQEQRAVNKLLKSAPNLPTASRHKLQAILHAHMAPNERSYRPLMQHYAVTCGDFGQVLCVLEAMKDDGVRISPAIFVLLFNAFKKYAEQSSSESGWTPATLQVIVRRFREEVFTNTEYTEMRPSLAWAALGALHHLDMIEDMRSLWRILIKKWDPPAWMSAKMQSILKPKLVQETPAVISSEAPKHVSCL